jgi:hypothetical protein
MWLRRFTGCPGKERPKNSLKYTQPYSPYKIIADRAYTFFRFEGPKIEKQDQISVRFHCWLLCPIWFSPLGRVGSGQKHMSNNYLLFFSHSLLHINHLLFFSSSLLHINLMLPFLTVL